MRLFQLQLQTAQKVEDFVASGSICLRGKCLDLGEKSLHSCRESVLEIALFLPRYAIRC